MNIQKKLIKDVRKKILYKNGRKHKKVRIINDFKIDYVNMMKHPILKNCLVCEVLYKGRDYEGGNED